MATTPTAGEARKALATLGLYFAKTPALQCAPDLMQELHRPMLDVVTDWAKGFGYDPSKASSAVGYMPGSSHYVSQLEDSREQR